MGDKNTLTIFFRNDTEERWIEHNPVLLDGEIAASLYGDNVRFKIGDGKTCYRDLDEVNLHTALKNGCMYVPVGTSFPWRKVKFKFLNAKLQEEVDSGAELYVDSNMISNLFKE